MQRIYSNNSFIFIVHIFIWQSYCHIKQFCRQTCLHFYKYCIISIVWLQKTMTKSSITYIKIHYQLIFLDKTFHAEGIKWEILSLGFHIHAVFLTDKDKIYYRQVVINNISLLGKFSMNDWKACIILHQMDFEIQFSWLWNRIKYEHLILKSNFTNSIATILYDLRVFSHFENLY